MKRRAVESYRKFYGHFSVKIWARYTVLIVLRAGKIALVCGLLKEKYIYSKYYVHSMQDHEKTIHDLKMLVINNVSLTLSPFRNIEVSYVC